MTDWKEKMHHLLDEAISPEGENVNFQALYDFLSAGIEYQTGDGVGWKVGRDLNTGDFSKLTSEHFNDQTGTDQLGKSNTGDSSQLTSEHVNDQTGTEQHGKSITVDCSQVASEHVNDQTGTGQHKKSNSVTGWFTITQCCDDLNRKIFRAGEIENTKTETSSSAATPRGSVVDSLSDTSRRASTIGKRVKSSRNPTKKIEWGKSMAKNFK